MKNSNKKIVFMGRANEKREEIKGELKDAFYVKFNSVNSEFENEFSDMMKRFQRLGRATVVKRMGEHSYKIERTPETDTVWTLILHRYMAERNNLWKEIETGIEFIPLKISFEAFVAA